MHPICFRFEYIMVKIFEGSRQNVCRWSCKSEPLFYNYLRPLTSLDEELYALAYEEDVHSYNRPSPRVRLTINKITDEPDSIATIKHRSEKILTWHDSSEPIKEHVCDHVTPSQVMKDVMRQLSFEETELDGGAGFGDVVGSEVIAEDYVSSREDVEQGNGPKNESAQSDGHFFYDDEGIDGAYETQYDVQSSKDAVPDDVLEGDDVDIINTYGFDSDHSNDNETSNYRRRRLAELSREMKGVINASGQWKYSFYTGQKFTATKEVKDKVYLHFIESRRNSKLYKNDSVRVRARCDEKVLVYTMSQGTRPTGPNHRMEAELSGLSGPNTRSKKARIQIFEQVRVNPEILVKAVQDQLQHDLELQISTSKIFKDKAKAEREIRGDHVLREVLGLDGAFMNGPFSGQLLAAVGLDSNNIIYTLAYALVEAESRAQSDLLLNNIYEVFNGKIVRGRDKPVITLLKYIREYYMKIIVNVLSVIDKYTSPLTPTTTRIMKSIKKEAHFMKVQWNRSNKYQVSGSLACWNMALNDRAAPPPEVWVNPYYWLTTWRETYSHKLEPINGTN
nr:hypothetical protein [Tanacetum cinerariifolium]